MTCGFTIDSAQPPAETIDQLTRAPALARDWVENSRAPGTDMRRPGFLPRARRTGRDILATARTCTGQHKPADEVEIVRRDGRTAHCHNGCRNLSAVQQYAASPVIPQGCYLIAVARSCSRLAMVRGQVSLPTGRRQHQPPHGAKRGNYDICRARIARYPPGMPIFDDFVFTTLGRRQGLKCIPCTRAGCLQPMPIGA